MTHPAQHSSILGQVDRAIYRVERLVAGGLFLFMSLVMFAYVAISAFERPESRLVSIFLDRPPTPENAWWHGPFSTGLSLGLTLLLTTLAARTRQRATRLGWGASLLWGVGLTAAAAGVVKGALWLFPNGMIWAPKLCSVCLLWVGLLGASMATHEKRHLALEMGEKLWPPKIFHYVKAVALVSAAAMAGFLLWLSWLSISDYRAHAQDIVDPSLPWQKWKLLLVVPYALAMMGFRFTYQSGRVLVHPEEAAGGELIPTVPGVESGGEGVER